MKRVISLLLVLVLCAGRFAAVRAEGVEIVQESLVYEADGEALAELNAVFPQLSGMEDVEAMERINAAIRDYILTEGEYDNICEYALDDYRDAPAKFAENEYSLEARAQAELLADGSLLSVRFDLLLSTGGPHPWDWIAAQHYLLDSGSPVMLEALLLTPEETRALVVTEATRQIAESGFDAFAEPNLSAWTPKQGLLTGEGLLVFYNEGDIGPVYSGPLEFTIPYSLLAGHLSPDLIPLPENPAPQELPERALAEALYAQASNQFADAYSEHGDCVEPLPGDEGYETYSRILRDVERAIELNPAEASFYYLYYDIAYTMCLFDEGKAAKARGNLLENPEDETAYLDLVYALEGKDLFEEAAGVYAQMLALTDPPGTVHAYQEAEDLFAASAYEACLPLYEQAVEEDQYTTLALLHRYEALMALERYEDAVAAAKEGGDLTGETFLFDCLAAEAYVKMGDVWSARRTLWGVLEVEPEYQRALDIQAAIDKMLPPGAEKAFAAQRWEGWEVVATGFNEESTQPYTVVAALRKDGENVLCVLRRTGEAYEIVLENGKALYPGERTPTLYYEGYEGEYIAIDYEVDLGRSIPGHYGFSFYNDEDTEKSQYEFLLAYREIPEPGDDGYTDRYGNFHSTVEIYRYEVSESDGALHLTERWGNATGDWDSEPEFLAEVEGNPKSLTLKSFDIAVCDAMLDSALANILSEDE